MDANGLVVRDTNHADAVPIVGDAPDLVVVVGKCMEAGALRQVPNFHGLVAGAAKGWAIGGQVATEKISETSAGQPTTNTNKFVGPRSP